MVSSRVKVVLGIGNPGSEYASTRHNVGWRVVERLALSLGVELRKKGKLRGLVGRGTVGSQSVLLVKPETYVNLSGECARAVTDYYGVGTDSLLVVADDVNLELGQLRCRRSGSAGGHNGLESIIRHLGTEDFARLRVGVGRGRSSRAEGDLVGHVLGLFSPEERPVAERAEARAEAAATDWVRSGVEVCMNEYNGPAEPDGSAEGKKEEL